MRLATGTFSGRNGYRLEGGFAFDRADDGTVTFQTSDDFFFGTSDGGGTPGPGFALISGDPTGMNRAAVEAAARASDFLRLDPLVAVTGAQTAQLPSGLDVGSFDTVFLWCFVSPVLLGVGPMLRGV